MENASAVELISNLIFMPGWTITASDHSSRFEGTITVRVDYPARNSNRDQAPDYPEEIATYAVFPMIVADCSDEDLYYKMIKVLAEIFEHETREFLRVPGTHWAPFHPHRVDGMKRWARVTGAPVGADLRFGLA